MSKARAPLGVSWGVETTIPMPITSGVVSFPTGPNSRSRVPIGISPAGTRPGPKSSPTRTGTGATSGLPYVPGITSEFASIVRRAVWPTTSSSWSAGTFA